MNIYFSGLGGVGIGPLAEIALDAGYAVTGSDASTNLMTTHLASRGVALSTDQSGDFLRAVHAEQPIDWFVHTAALPDTHPELVAARELGIKTSKRDELLAHIIAKKNLKLIAVAGTHGKTTTTGMTVWVMKQRGIAVSYSVGTTLSWGPSGLYDPDSEYFVYECDEFDRNFLHFHPYLSLITSLEYDHPDTYPTHDEYTAAFTQFMTQSDHVIGWSDEIKPYVGDTSSWLLQDTEVHDFTLAGKHNRRNATLVLKAMEYLGLGDATDVLNTFPGTNRRFEKLQDNLYTDYGHTPTEIRATLQMAKELSDKVVLVYQPHQNIRQHEIIDQYTDALFTDADELFWLPTYLSREDPNLSVLTADQLTAKLARTNLHMADFNDDLRQTVKTLQDQGQLVLFMGAGSIDGWVRQNLSARDSVKK